MRPSNFDFDLPPERIAQHALRRGASRLMLVPRQTGRFRHAVFKDICQWFRPGDCLVLNNTKVIPARLFALKKSSGIQIEIFLHREIAPGIWEALARPCRRLKPGMVLYLGEDGMTIAAIPGKGIVHVRFASAAKARLLIRRYGITPLPPYIKRTDKVPGGKTENEDRKRYQTVYARQDGSVAAPTAGLHFTQSILKRLQQKGVCVAEVTLHVGWGTFASLPDEDVSGRRLHTEQYTIDEKNARMINQSKRLGGRIIACGTTAARALESAAVQNGAVSSGNAMTDIFIYPGYQWKIVAGLLTNFHLPMSSLFILVCALADTHAIKQAYAEAVRENYRFYSYGDAMLIV
ncbi:tRNA preQ1(34) S-adenosylmethionine ribosyltransferase-isomerase QueA [bacterium]|nr:tRNA preQ1(34) S-adenosylmethionine ribosyltransferase-isomerase QueA [bacterium]